MRNFFNQILRFLLVADLDDKIYKECIEDIKKTNMGAIKAITLVGSIVFAIISLLSAYECNLMRCYVNLIYLIPFLFIQVITRIKSPKRGSTVALLGIILMVLLYTYGILIGVIFNTKNSSVTFVAIILAISILFVEKPWRILCIGAFFTCLMCALSAQYKTADLAILDSDNYICHLITCFFKFCEMFIKYFS